MEQIDMWKKYKHGDREILSPLLRSFDPLLQHEVNKWKSFNVPKAVLMADAKINAVKAFDTYNPARGASLPTHLVNRLRKVSRTAYKYGSPVYVPEHRARKLAMFKNVLGDLRIHLDREPSIQEMAEKLKWSPNDVAAAMRETTGVTYMNPRFPDISYTPATSLETVIRYVYDDLSPEQQVVMERMTGMHGKERSKSLLDLSKTVNMPYHQVRKAKAAIMDRIQEGMGLFGKY